jgi:holo-[acyl-carrier protein] synthase
MIVGVGIDIIDIRRVRKILERQGERFMRRVFTAGEQEYCMAHRDAALHFAARFAAKEALFKALGTGWAQGVTWLDAEVRRESSGAPRLVLCGSAEEVSKGLGTQAIHLSLSHSEEAAIALVILEK